MDTPPIPVRMVNEFVYCPRLAHLMWVEAEFAENADTVEGSIRHKRVDAGSGRLPEAGVTEAAEKIHARSVYLTSDRLGITAKIDLVEGAATAVSPVDYKKGKRPHTVAGAYAPERVQVCAQGMILREHGYVCEEGFIYFVQSRERVRVRFDNELTAQTLAAIDGLRKAAESEALPPPLADSPKCPRCSLMGICLPDETAFLNHGLDAVRPMSARRETGLPLYVQAAGAYVRKDGGRLVIEEKKEPVGNARLEEVSQVALFGHTGISTPALHECFRRNIPVTFLSYGGWFLGHTGGTGHKNVIIRTNQYRASFDERACLRLSRKLVVAKIQNCRTLMRRNRKDGGETKSPPGLLVAMKNDIARAGRAQSLPELLGAEGNAARRYFEHFTGMLSPDLSDVVDGYDFNGRNRRPPKDPVNAMLSFGYAMLVREWTVALSAVGLDPYRGFFHQMRFGRPALALDMMEPFRPLVADSTVITVINNGEVRPGDFVRAAGSCALKPGARKRFIAAFERRLAHEVTHPLFRYRINYRRLFEVHARLLIRFLSGEISRYPAFVTR